MIILIPAEERVCERRQSLLLSLFTSPAPPNHLPFSPIDIQVRTALSEVGISASVRVWSGARHLERSAKVNRRKTWAHATIQSVHVSNRERLSSPTSASLCVFIIYLRYPLNSPPMHQSTGTIIGEMRLEVSGWEVTCAIQQSNLNPTRPLSLSPSPSLPLSLQLCSE